ncbi:M67 family metallopeptidase [Tautonia sp. JC769]|uniref:M67 family metallopeptidase n=1 Tax=Tautonia sp. JC769 TaxID=3232135 RepID=UPI003458F437
MSDPEPTSPSAGDLLEIPGSILHAMIEHCLRESPLEACGLLGGRPPRVSSFHPLRNAAQSETRYDADPADLIAAVRQLRGQSAQILAIYHSHPKWPAIPSGTDLRENYYEEVPRIIVSLQQPEPEVRIWRLRPDGYDELPWRTISDG